MDNQIGLIKFDQIVPNGTISFKFQPNQNLQIKIHIIYQNWVYNITSNFLKEYLTNFTALPIQENPSLLFTTCMDKKFFSKEQIKMFGMDEKKPQKSLISSRSKENFDYLSSTSARSSESSSISPPITARESLAKIEKLTKTLSGNSIDRGTSNLELQKTRERKGSNREKRKSKDSRRNSREVSAECDLKNQSSSSTLVKSSSSSSDSKSPRYISIRKTNDSSPNDLEKSALELEKKFQIESATPLLVFGKMEWEKWIGKLDDKSDFLLPFNVMKVQDMVSPFWEEMKKTYGETNMLLLIPAMVNNNGLSPKYFDELTSSNKFKRIVYSYHCGLSDYEKEITKSYWAFITKGPVPQTFKLSHDDALKFIAEKINLCKKSVEFSNKSCEVPAFIEVALSNYVASISEMNLYSNISTRCQEKVQNGIAKEVPITMGNYVRDLTIRDSTRLFVGQGQTIVSRFSI